MTISPVHNIDFSFSSASIEEAQRLFHGRGKAYPGLEHVVIDWLPPVILITVYQSVDRVWLMQLAEQLNDRIPASQSVQVQYRYQRGGPFEYLLGEVITDLTVIESGLHYHIQLGKAQNSGLFLDMKCGRDWVRARAKGKRILNLFSYTCGFSVAAMAGGASYVVNIDNNSAVLKRGLENHRLNNIDTRDVRFEKLNIFNSWSRIKKYGPYDMLICDPPTFQAGSVDIKRDYQRIIKRIPQLMNDNSEIVLCLNAPDLSGEFLDEQVILYCPECEFKEKINPPVVFKEMIKGSGLKTHVFHFHS